MFEKDDDYRKARKESKDEITKVIGAWSAREETLHNEGFQKGAEFGYNKAKVEVEELEKKAEKSFEKARRRNIALNYGSYYDGYFAGAEENGIVWHKTGTPRENVLTIIEVENCGYSLCRYRNGFWYEDDSGAIYPEFITNNILRWAEIPTFKGK